MPISLEQVSDTILRVGLLHESELSDAMHGLQKLGGKVDGERLLAHLEADGKLTKFQSRQLARGRGAELVLGNYLLMNRIGEGGMGVVFKALHRRMERLVALKVIKRSAAKPDFIKRFEREIRAAARLNHPNVVAAYDADECELGDFLVMEFIDGSDLEQVVEHSGPLSVPKTIDAIRQAALGLSYSHGQGVVHRDIKPSNLMRDVAGHIKIADLGLAQLSAARASRSEYAFSEPGMVAGTVDYMSPEQATDTSSVDHRADIYSLGCTLFYLLAGGPVFPDGNLMARLLAHREQPPPLLHEIVPGAPAELNAIFQRMVAKRVEERFQSMDEVTAALDNLQSAKQEAATPQIDISQCTVALVEQSKLQAGMIKKLLGEIGIDDVHACETGEEALELLSRLKARILITSMRLQDMTGVGLAELIRDELSWSQTSVLLMTSDGLSEQAGKSLSRLSGTTVLKKPFRAEQLAAKIRELLEAESHVEQKIAGFGQLEVLIADDSSVARRRIQSKLAELGFANFTAVPNGTHAAEAMSRSKFDLVVTDYNMPEMNGYALVSHIREESSQPEVPIIMVTTEYDPQKLADVYALGVSAICNKSFDIELVRNIVMRLFM